ncbi:MAG TPA: hypothetical protein ENI87_05895 [bacterium]|nr:hypothetical protein [bacterium]
MVRSIGIDPGDRTVHVVELDGSYRRTRLLRAHSAPVGGAPVGGSGDPLRPDAVAEVAREAIDTGMKGEIALGFPAREAVLRTIELPFTGADAIRKVVKAEIEGEIYTHSVDDMVVDFHEIGEGVGGGSRILVASVPKAGLRNQLTSLEAQHIDVETVDLDAMALWRAADWVGAFDADDGDGTGEEDGEGPVHAVLDVGERSVKVILSAGDQLLDMRTLRLGDGVVVDQVARRHGLDLGQARAAVADVLRTGADAVVEMTALPAPAAAEDAGRADAGEGESASVPVPVGDSVKVTFEEVDQAHTKYLQRLARELTRFLTASGLAARVRSAWICGSACRGQGITEMLAAVFGVAPRELDVLAHLAHDLDDDEAAELSPQLAVAVGLALARLGGPKGFNLRQEELARTGGFDRIKFPLAITCMVALLAVFVAANKKSMELKKLELYLGKQYVDPKRPKVAIFHGLLNPLFFPARWFEDKQYFSTKIKGRPYGYRELVDELAAAPVYRRLAIVRDRLRTVARNKQKETGVYEDISLESGLAVLVRWAEMLKAIEPQLGRYLVPEIDLDMSRRKLTFKVAFRGEDFRARKSALMRAVQVEIGKPDSPFKEPERGSGEPPETLFSDRDETGVTGAYYDVTIDIKEVFAPFGV